MKRETVGEILFWGATAFAFALYWLTALDGLMWRPILPSHPAWQYLDKMAGGAVALTSLSAAVAAGLLGALVNRYFGWRIGAAAALVWATSPWVWNRAIVGERSVCYASAAVLLLWLGNAVLLWVTRKAREIRAVSLSDHDTADKRAWHNRIASWSILGMACLFAVVSATWHNYRLGDPTPDLKRLEQYHFEMMKAYYAKDLAKSAHIAHAIISYPRWNHFIPAYLVLGTALAGEGNYEAAAAFYGVAITGKGVAAPPAFVYNDYAEVLRLLKRYDEAEKYARRAVAKGSEKAWIFRLTLAQVLRDSDKVVSDKVNALTTNHEPLITNPQKATEIQSLLKDILKYAPEKERARIRKEFAQ